MTKHSDGPAYAVGPSHNFTVARVFHPPVCERDTILANARLIASAPELLRLLKEALGVNQKDRSIEDWLNEARQVIAKVEK